MQQTLSYSSSPSPTLIPTIAHPTRSPARARTTDSPAAAPAIISVDFSCDPNRIMSPSAHSNVTYSREQRSSDGMASSRLYVEKTASNTQPYSSLFGDPVPPPQPEDYFGTAAFETFRAGSIVDMPSSEEDTLVAAVAHDTLVGNESRRRLFSNVPYTSSGRVETKLNMLPMSIPRLQPPDIQILPNSSGGSSTEHLDSPNFMLLAPQDIVNKPDVYECEYESASQVPSHTFRQMSVASNMDEESQIDRHTFRQMSIASNMDEESQIDRHTFRQMSVASNMDDESQIDRQTFRQMSVANNMDDESQMDRHRAMSGQYSSTGLDWYRPAPEHYAEFSRIPKLRPSSKMIMSMKHEEMPLSPLATMLQDSNGSSSGGEDQFQNNMQQMNERLPISVPASVSSARPASLMDMDIILSPKQYLQQQRDLLRNISAGQLSDSFKMSYGISTPRTPSVCHSQRPESITDVAMTSPEENCQKQTHCQSIAGEMSPVVIKDSISTGGEYRVGDTRLHKKSSFTILSVRSPKSSLTHTPSTTPVAQRRLPATTGRHPSIQSTTTSSIAAQPQIRPRRKSLTGSRLPQLPPSSLLASNQAIDDSPRPSVQFNMSGGYSPSKLAMPKKGILQQRDSLTSSVDTYTPRAQRRESIKTNTFPTPFGQRIRSMETLPLITDPYRSAIPRFHRSSMELDKEISIIPPGSLPRPLKPNPNPTRKQRGLLGVINKEEESARLAPRSNWLSLDDLVLGQRQTKSAFDPMRIQARRRSSSTSPERRSSTQTASDRRSSNLSSITTSDFSFRRPSLTTLPATAQRRQSVYQPATKLKSPRRQPFSSSDAKQQSRRAKIAKPTTLSPILGTPNKDSGKDSPLHGSAYEAAHRDTPSDFSTRRDSISRIPVRSRTESRPGSRSTSPQKDFGSTSILSGRTSRTSLSRSPSHATMRSGTAENRLSPSRPVSRGPPSRPTSRIALAPDSAANSRANSRLSVRSSMRSSSISPANIARNGRGTATMPNRRKSISISPKGMPARGIPVRRKSLSPVAKKGTQSPKRGRKEVTLTSQRRNSQSRIPTSTSNKAPRSSSPSKKQSTTVKKPAEKLKTPRSPKGKKTTQQKPQNTSTKSPKEKSNKAESAKKKTTPTSKADLSVKRTASKLPNKPTSKQKTPQLPKKELGQNTVKAKTASKTNGTNGANGLPRPLTRVGSQQNIKKDATEITATKPTHKESPQKVDSSFVETTTEGLNPLAVQVGNAVLQAAEALPAVRNEVNATATGAMKRQGSNMSTLVRMGSRLSLISNRKRLDSAQSRKVATVKEVTNETNGTAKSLATNEHTTTTDGKGGAGSTTVEGTQKSITESTLETHESSPKTLESESGQLLEHSGTPSPNDVTKTFDATSRLDTADGSNAPRSSGDTQKSPPPPTQPIEASISVLNSTADAASIQAGAHALSTLPEIDNERANTHQDQAADFDQATSNAGRRADFEVDDKRLSPDGQGGSTAGSGGIAKTSSQEFLKDDVAKGGCCRCCSTLCMRFRRSHCFRCCGLRKDRHHDSVEEQPVLSSARSSATTTTQLVVVDEDKSKKKSSCWPKSNCCRSCRKKPANGQQDKKETNLTAMSVEPVQQTNLTQPKQQGKCGRCWQKIFCCRSVNKVDPKTGDETELKKCCFCIPCRRKRGGASSEPKVAWRDRDPELGINATDAAVLEGSSEAPSTAAAATEDMPPMSCCKRFWLKLCCCCRKKPRRASDARRKSIIAPPPSEDTRRKLHNDLVEYSSKMKGAIPVLPLYLAWFCAFCNVVFPGLGTLLSGLFCLCVGIPRFSQFDSARARIGSFIINIIVAVSQFLTVLFCFVGWGWSIWWGTIMLKCARKLSKIKKVERLELEEEQRQAELAAAAAKVTRTEAEPVKT